MNELEQCRKISSKIETMLQNYNSGLVVSCRYVNQTDHRWLSIFFITSDFSFAIVKHKRHFVNLLLTLFKALFSAWHNASESLSCDFLFFFSRRIISNISLPFPASLLSSNHSFHLASKITPLEFLLRLKVSFNSPFMISSPTFDMERDEVFRNFGEYQPFLMHNACTFRNRNQPIVIHTFFTLLYLIKFSFFLLFCFA